MTTVYKIGFRDGTPVAEAKQSALARVRETDDAPVTAGPQIVQTAAHQEAGEFLVRIVTGGRDPREAAARRRAHASERSAADAVIGRLAELPPAKIAALNELLDRLEG